MGMIMKVRGLLPRTSVSGGVQRYYEMAVAAAAAAWDRCWGPSG
jgi:hypothetical protein